IERRDTRNEKTVIISGTDGNVSTFILKQVGRDGVLSSKGIIRLSLARYVHQLRTASQHIPAES
ncbi:hypothetical protein, partial [Leptolyngbya sp. FACHB-36]|uniref:hypothetical protein n=1 Tax=Leptolyngbya sp. FACHB-36 TaxID=2692808 RepID=UPI001A7E9B79